MYKLLKKYPKQIDIALLIIGFSVGANLFIFFKFSGLKDLGVQLPDAVLDINYFTPTIGGLFIGLGFSLLEFRLFPNIFPRISQYLIVPIRLITYSIVIILSIVAVQIIANVLFRGLPLDVTLDTIGKFLQTSMFTSLFIYLMFLGIALNFIRAMGNRFGHGILMDFVFGKYSQPTEEKRIFMFMDLNDSTKIAEKLGHTMYSEFINKCFTDLSILLPDYEAEVYQFVGDEAVLTWRSMDDVSPEMPIKLYFHFEKILKEHESEYLEKFQVVPQFKAALNVGNVIVTEVGSLRKERAYHGDVLNTASRILELCSEYNKGLLATSSIISDVQDNTSMKIDFLTDLKLRGKKYSTAIYAVDHVGEVSLV